MTLNPPKISARQFIEAMVDAYDLPIHSLKHLIKLGGGGYRAMKIFKMFRQEKIDGAKLFLANKHRYIIPWYYAEKHTIEDFCESFWFMIAEKGHSWYKNDIKKMIEDFKIQFKK